MALRSAPPERSGPRSPLGLRLNESLAGLGERVVGGRACAVAFGLPLNEVDRRRFTYGAAEAFRREGERTRADFSEIH
jgi:hypothetical protein